MNIVVTGTGGRLGAAVARHLRQNHRVVAYDRRAMDLRSPEQIRDHLLGLQFDVLINCAAVTSPDYAEQHPDEARDVNTLAPQLMAELCQQRGARMIQLSTDYVYDGSQPGLRRETDLCGPLGIYARTKHAGDLAVLAAGDRHLVARTAWVFGPDRPSFVDQIIARAQKETDCEAIADKFGSASYSADMAVQLEYLARHPDASGIVNLCNTGLCSWFDLGQAALNAAVDLGWKLRCRTLRPRRLRDITAFIAPRPVYTSMDTTRLGSLTGRRPRPWQDALCDYLATYYGKV
jgi:dTDP-4-dehydrorhamnose reductase